MLQVDILDPSEIARAATIFHRDGFVVIRDALTPDQLATARAGADRVMREQMATIAPEAANRGHSRYSFGQQIQHPEWQMLLDLPTVLPIIEAIWNSDDFYSGGGGGDYCAPGAKIQSMHSDLAEAIHDPHSKASIQDMPAPFIVVNFPCIDFTVENGGTRFVPGTQRSREPIPKLADEPLWMQNNVLCAPAGCALIRDVRCWHGGTENRSQDIRPMVSVGYYAPWFMRPNGMPQTFTHESYAKLSPRAKRLLRFLVKP